jgi:hypothetical protein
VKIGKEDDHGWHLFLTMPDIGEDSEMAQWDVGPTRGVTFSSG